MGYLTLYEDLYHKFISILDKSLIYKRAGGNKELIDLAHKLCKQFREKLLNIIEGLKTVSCTMNIVILLKISKEITALDKEMDVVNNIISKEITEIKISENIEQIKEDKRDNEIQLIVEFFKEIN